MPILDAFPRAARLVRGRSVAPRENGGLGGLIGGLVGQVEDLECDVSQLTGPYACLHNEHNAILRNIDTVLSNQQELEDKIDTLQSRLDEVSQALARTNVFLDKVFEGNP